MELLKETFTAPSGNTYTIREQNGNDEEILTNVKDINEFMNISKFIQAILVDGSWGNRKPSLKEVMDIPVLDRCEILIRSRILSIGKDLVFNYTWKNGDKESTYEYEEDLTNYLMRDDFDSLSEEEAKAYLEENPQILPKYPFNQAKDIIIDLPSGKRVKFDLLDGNGEKYLATLQEHETNRNSELVARNLNLLVDGKWERVRNFSLFSYKDMINLRNQVHSIDPSFNPVTDVTNPVTGEVVKFPIMSAPSFFFPEEV